MQEGDNPRPQKQLAAGRRFCQLPITLIRPQSVREKETMTWPLFWQLFATVIVAFSGAWLAHFFAARRDQKNNRRNQRIAFLIDAYRRLEFVSNRPSSANSQQIESALADIQLFGSASQISLVQDFIKQFAAAKSASLDTILNELRKDLRAELQLEGVSDHLLFLRFPANKDEATQQMSRTLNQGFP